MILCGRINMVKDARIDMTGFFTFPVLLLDAEVDAHHVLNNHASLIAGDKMHEGLRFYSEAVAYLMTCYWITNGCRLNNAIGSSTKLIGHYFSGLYKHTIFFSDPINSRASCFPGPYLSGR